MNNNNNDNDNSWSTCKSFAPSTRQITMPASQSLRFYRLDALLDAPQTVSKHLRQ